MSIGRDVMMVVVLGLVCAVRPLAAQNPVPVQIEVSPINTVNYDPTERLEFSGGHVVTFSVTNVGATGGPDAKVAFTCQSFGSVVSAICPSPQFVAPGGLDVKVVSVTLTLGLGGQEGWVELTATAVAPGPTGSFAIGRRDVNVITAASSFSPAAAATTKAKSTSGTQTFSLMNTGQLSTSYALAFACPSGFTACSVSPTLSAQLLVGGAQTVTVNYTTPANATVAIPTLEASVGSHVLSAASVTVGVVDAALAASQNATTVTAGTTAILFSGFTATKVPSGPDASYDVSFAFPCAVVTNCRFANGQPTTTVSLTSATPSQVIPVLFDALTAGSGGSLAVQISFQGTVLSTSTLSINVASPVTVTLTPAAASTSALTGSTGNQFGGFTITNSSGSPAAATVGLSFTVCATVSTCRFSNGTDTLSVPLAVGASQSVPVSFSAPTAGTGTVTLRLAYGGATVATATLTVVVSSASIVVVPTGGGQPKIVGPAQSSQLQLFQVVNNGASATFSFTHNCVSMTQPAAATACQASANQTINQGTSGTPSVSFTSGSTKGVQSTLTLGVVQGSTPVGSGSAIVIVPNASITPPTPITVPQGVPSGTSFTVQNTGPGTIQYFMTVACSGAGLTCSLAQGASLTLSPSSGAGSTGTTSVTYSGGSPGAGTMTLEARLVSTTGPIIASSAVAVTVQVAVAGMTVTTANITSDSSLFREQCVAMSLGAEVASECGDLRVVHVLPGVRTMNVARAPVLTYSSGHARSYPIVPADLTLPTTSQIPTSVSAALKINNVTVASGSWAGTQWTAGSTRRVALGFDAAAAGFASGVYAYVLEVTATFGTTTSVTQGAGQLIVVNRAASYFGAGWWLAGLEALDLSVPSKVLWYGGDGSVRTYQLMSGTVAPTRVWSAPSMTYPDILREVGAEFVRLLPDSVSVFFNAQGRHVRTRNRLGHVTTFAYDGSGRLQSITVPPASAPLTYTFNYDANGKLATVSAPGQSGTRTVTVSTNATTGRITSIQDPGTPTRIVQFAYVSDHRITGRTNGNGAVTTFGYDAASRVSQASLAMSPGTISRSVVNWQLYGLPGTSAAPTQVSVVHSGPRAGQTTQFYLNKYGAATSIVDALAQTTTLVRGVGAFPGLVTQITTVAAHTISATYDARGRLLSSSSPSSTGAMATTSYVWDPAWDTISSQTNPEGDFMLFGVDPGTGNRLWQEDNRGPASRTTFAYTANNQLANFTPPASPAEEFTYDVKGNLDSRSNGLDMLWLWTNNTIGLPTSARVPIGDGSKPGWTPRETTTRTFSERNEEKTSARGTDGASNTITNSYDAEGNLLSVQRSWLPNPQSLAAQTTTYGYDNADRVVTQTESTGGTTTTGFDASGNATSVITRRGDGLSMGYDLLDRLTSRSIPSGAAFAFPSPNLLPVTNVESGPYVFARPSETQTFTYHPTNQIATATGLDADVLRSYHASGVLQSETQSIRTRSRASAPHVYTLLFVYDRNNRRTSLSLSPSALFAGSAMTYHYTGWGALSSVTDVAGNSFSFAYNGKDELTSTGYPAGLTQALSYDQGGRLSADVITTAGPIGFPYAANATIRNFAVSKRNARGQILTSSDPAIIGGGFPVSTYTGLGYLNQSQLTSTGYQNQNGIPLTFASNDTYVTDGLGNLLSSIGGWSLPPNAVTYSTTNTYTPQSRLALQTTVTGGVARSTTYAYDAAGNTRFEATALSGASNTVEERASFYAGDDRLVAVDRRVSGRRTLEEFRYDALGRRVWVSTTTNCAPSNDISCLTSAVRRTVWDGAQERAEIQAPRDTTQTSPEELDAGFPLLPYVTLPSPQNGDANPFYGRVVYSPGLAIDQPLSVTRYDYRDYPSGSDSLTWPRMTTLVWWDYRGVPAYGLFDNGTWARAYTPGVGQSACPNVGVVTRQRCVLQQWPFAANAYDKARGQLQYSSWQGSLLRNKQDGTGLEFKRHRVYDPQSGRFTQEDPIGLAGGLNLYGYANGDPVNFSDPFGLFGCTRENPRDCRLRDVLRNFASGFAASGTPGFGEDVGPGFKTGLAAGLILQGGVGRAPAGMAGLGAETGAAVAPSARTLASFERQLAKSGRESLVKSAETIGQNLAEHISDLARYRAQGGYTSSVEREIRTMRSQLDAIRQILERNK